jgi:hypothetical protein
MKKGPRDGALFGLQETATSNPDEGSLKMDFSTKPARSTPSQRLPISSTVTEIEGSHAKQRLEIYNALLCAFLSGREWVPTPELAKCALQYNARILELRRAGIKVENRIRKVDGVRRSWFRVAPAVSECSSSPSGSAGSVDSRKIKSSDVNGVSRERDEQFPLFSTGGRS